MHTPNIYVLSGIRTHDPSVRASEGSSCLRSRGYRDRLASERAKTVHVLDRTATVTGRIIEYVTVIPPASVRNPDGDTDAPNCRRGDCRRFCSRKSRR
jgi:hypothetical protein